jgi:hypothetical protein
MTFMFYKILIPLFFLVSCSPYPNLEEIWGDESKVSVLEEGPDFRAKLRAETKAHHYSAVLSWNLNTQEPLSLYRYEASSEAEFLGVQGSQGSYFDQNLKEKTHYTYELRGAGDRSHYAEIRTGRDLLVRDIVELPQDYKTYTRLFLEKDAVLISKGASVDWHLLEVIAGEASRFVSFLEEDAGKNPSEQAKASGLLHLSIEKAHGVLAVEWRGQRGAQGLRGDTPAGRAATGAAGKPAYLREGACRFAGGSYDCEPSVCVAGGTGGQGAQGARGLSGGSGGQGGDLQNVWIDVRQPSEGFFMHLISHGGRAGLGGEGGLGGLGGLGGEGGRGHSCPAGARGSEGLRGAQGERGPIGQRGSDRADVCVKLGSKVLRGPCLL